MSQVQNGSTVKVHYTGTFDDGTVFDSSVDRDPMEFTIGEGKLIPGFEQAVIGMNVGDSTTQRIPAEEAYGPHIKELIVEVDKSQFPPDMTPEIGLQLQIRQDNGQTTIVRITGISEDKVTLDANHPLAGKDLNFEIKLVEVV